MIYYMNLIRKKQMKFLAVIFTIIAIVITLWVTVIAVTVVYDSFNEYTPITW